MDFFVTLILWFMTVFSISSMILYSPLFETIREKWIAYFDSKDNWLLNKLQHLMICQLCISFHIAYLTGWLFFPNLSIIWYFILAFPISGFSWSLGASTLKNLWQRAMNEKVYNKLIKKD